MKKLLLALIFLLIAAPAYSATWYACKTANIDSVSAGTTSDVWYSAAACTGGSFYTWTSTFDDGLNAGDILRANSYTITITVNPGATGKKVILDTLTAGGGFAFGMGSNLTINADITAGTTDCLTLTGSANTLTIVGNITGSSTTNSKSGVLDGRTGGTVVITGNVSGGANNSAVGFKKTAAGGTVTISGNCSGGTRSGGGCMFDGFYATVTVAGDCVGGGSAGTSSYGCAMVANASASMIVQGNILDSATSVAIYGKVQWQPGAATNYYRKLNNSTGPAYYYMTPNPDPAVTNVKTGVTYGFDGSSAYTGTYSAGGGGAWSF